MIGKRIAARREALGLTQREVADRAEMDPQHLSKIEREESSPRYVTLEKIAAALDTTVEELARIPPQPADSTPPPSS